MPIKQGTLKEWTNMDKSKWPKGPWNKEPDKRQWVDEKTGFACLMKRNEVTGSWCGYVGLPPGHKFYQFGYDNPNVRVHGGLTFASMCSPVGNDPGMAKHHVWWFGFDCAYADDLLPGLGAFYSGDEYRDVAYVEAETERLAWQLRE